MSSVSPANSKRFRTPPSGARDTRMCLSVPIGSETANVSLRSVRGSALTEFGPALFFLLIFAFFPVLDLIFIGVSYCSCMSLNNLQLREAAKVGRTEATSPTGSVQQGIPNSWRMTHLGNLASIADNPQTDVTYSAGIGSMYVTVSTTVSISPLLTIPFFPGVPGLGAPLVCTITRSRMLENPQSVFR